MIKKTYFLFAAWLISCGVLIGSLYMSEVLNYQPCTLCWCQRICLFPLPILLGIALYKGFLGIALYAIPFPLLAFGFSSYQVLLSFFPSFQKIHTCSAAGSCLFAAPPFFGTLSPAMISTGASFTMIVFLILSYQRKS